MAVKRLPFLLSTTSNSLYLSLSSAEGITISSSSLTYIRVVYREDACDGAYIGFGDQSRSISSLWLAESVKGD